MIIAAVVLLLIIIFIVPPVTWFHCLLYSLSLTPNSMEDDLKKLSLENALNVNAAAFVPNFAAPAFVPGGSFAPTPVVSAPAPAPVTAPAPAPAPAAKVVAVKKEADSSRSSSAEIVDGGWFNSTICLSFLSLLALLYSNYPPTLCLPLRSPHAKEIREIYRAAASCCHARANGRGEGGRGGVFRRGQRQATFQLRLYRSCRYVQVVVMVAVVVA